MTHGVAGAMINAALILGELAPWVEVYDPSRKTPSAIGNFLKENVTAVTNFAEYLAPGELSDFSELKSGKARSSGRAYPRSRPIGTKMDRCTQARPPARILAAIYTGTASRPAGIVPVTARSSRLTERF